MEQKFQETEKYRVIVNDPENEQLLWHKWVEIGFVLNGCGNLVMDEHSYPLQKNDIFVVNSYQLHRVELVEGSHLLSLMIQMDFQEYLLPQADKYMFECKSFLYPNGEQQRFDRLRRQLAHVIYTWSKAKEQLADVHIHTQLVILMECLIQYFGQEQKEERKKEDRFIDLIRYLNEHYMEDISQQMLAERAFLSPSYFSRLFQKKIGITFSEYLTNIRLSHAVSKLSRTDLTITEVAYQTGFKNVNSFIEFFKQKYGQTPGQYRKGITEKVIPRQTLLLEGGDEFSALFGSLLQYVNEDEKEESRQQDYELQEIQIQEYAGVETILPVWKQLLNVGYAKDLLNAEVQRQIIRTQREIGFRLIRFHGLLDDDMQVYQEKADGTPVYNFHYVDQVLDFVLQNGLHPLIEFSYMPKALAWNKEARPFLRCSIVSLPEDQLKWEKLQQVLMEHWIERYGKREMRQWVFSPFYNPDFIMLYQQGGWQEYQALYERSWQLIKGLDAGFQVIAPGCTINQFGEMEDFLVWCKERSCLPDILGVCCFYTEDETEDEIQDLKLVETDTAFSVVISKNEDYLAAMGESIRKLLKELQLQDMPVMLEEWNSNVWQRDLANDTRYKSAFLFKNVLENVQNYAAFGYWTLSDYMEEVPASEDLFHGGFGLYTACGIPKSGYQALYLLNFLGERVLAKGKGYLVTEKEDEIQIFLYHYCHYDTFYRYRHATKLSRTDRYHVFQQGSTKIFHIHFLQLEPGNYRIRRYEISAAGGSSYDAWVQMGAPKSLDPYEKQLLESKSYPQYQTEWMTCTGSLVVKAAVEPHGVSLIRIQKR